MSPWLRRLFLKTLPPYLLISLPEKPADPRDLTNELKNQKSIFSAFQTARHSAAGDGDDDDTTKPSDSGYIYPAELNRAIRNALYISYHLDNETSYETVSGLDLNFGDSEFQVLNEI